MGLVALLVYFERQALALGECLDATALDVFEVREEILAAVIGGDSEAGIMPARVARPEGRRSCADPLIHGTPKRKVCASQFQSTMSLGLAGSCS